MFRCRPGAQDVSARWTPRASQITATSVHVVSCERVGARSRAQVDCAVLLPSVRGVARARRHAGESAEHLAEMSLVGQPGPSLANARAAARPMPVRAPMIKTAGSFTALLPLIG